MRLFSRVAFVAAPFICLLGAAILPAPSFASEAPEAPIASATSLLAAVTGPLIAANMQALATQQPNFSTAGTNDGSAAAQDGDTATSASSSESLPDLVAEHASESAANDETQCLASSVYYESKGEPLAGQLAVAQTIMNRTRSSRFPSTVCGVVRQHGQFSFLRGGEIPTPPQDSNAWQTAVAIAQIAQQGLWKQTAPDALYFHAARVSPGWGKTRVAALGHHIFFR